MRRRNFLLGSSIAAGSLTMLGRTRSARAFGEIPASMADFVVPQEDVVESVLEVFLFGGVSQHESFYAVPEFGANEGTHYNAFAPSELEAVATTCGFSGELLSPFTQDEEGRTVHLGPFLGGLRERADLVDRMRIVCVQHDFLPHEAAIPLALSGRPPGTPSLAGLGAHIQRYFDLRDGAGVTSFVVRGPSPVQADLAQAVTATGLHPGNARPVALTVGGEADFLQLLERNVVQASAARVDALHAANSSRFARRLQRPDIGAVRSRHFGDLQAAMGSVSNSAQLLDILVPSLFAPATASSCGLDVEVDQVGMATRLAAHLLTNGTSPARYVCLVDGGFDMTGADAGGYDSHTNTPTIQATNLTALFRSLAAVINAPGENDPTKINLDKTLILLNTEFGRTPQLVGDNLGRGHWPGGYPIAVIGGPVKSRSIYGALGADGYATRAINTQMHRMGMLMAMGIWPFEDQSFNVADVQGAIEEPEAAQVIRSALLGIG